MDWTAVLRRATTIAEVIEVVDEYVSSQTNADWQTVPQSVRRPVIVSALDLERWHHAVVKALSESPKPGKALLEFAKVSLHAVARMHQIRLRIEPRDDDASDEGYSARRRCA